MPHGWLPARLGTALVLFTLLLSTASTVGADPAPSTPANFPPLGAAAGVGSKFGLVTHIATRFGIYGQQNGPMDVAAGTGVGWIREEFRWDWVEHPLGNWDWGFTDEMVQDARGRNLEILGLLGYNNSAQTMGEANFTVPDIGLWKTYITQVVTHYKGQIHAWEVWNEPDVPYFWKGSVADYVNLLKETYVTIKAIDPTATVLNGACSNLDLNWFTDFLNQGGTQYTDALAFHPYTLRSSLDNGNYQTIDLPHLRDIGQRTGKAWWFTEIGWSSASGGAGFGSGVGSEQAQASYMVRQYVESLDLSGLNVEHIFWYNFHDDGTDPSNPENNYGLIRNDWRTPKFSYTAFQQMTSHLSGAVAQGTVDSGAGIAYRFIRNGTTVDVVWGGGRTNLPTTATKAQAYDLSGNALPTEVSGGQAHVTIGPEPVFIEHAGTPPAAPPAAPPANPANTFTLPPAAPQAPKPGIIGKK
jgi:polysaccharide biosynthesis protein PslG